MNMKNFKNKIGLLAGIAFAGISMAQDIGFEWVRSVGGSGANNSQAYAVVTDAAGNVYTTGSFEGVNDFNPGTTTNFLSSAGGTDVFIQKMDAAGNYLWAKKIGGTGADAGSSIALDASGNVCITGSFSGTVDLDPGTGSQAVTSAGSTDIFVLILDASGNFVRAYNYGGTGSDLGKTISTDGSGNVYVSGDFNATVDFDPTAGTSNYTSLGSSDMFFQKIDATGAVMWTKQIGGTGAESCYTLKSDASGNIAASGFFRNTVDFDPDGGIQNHISVGNSDIFILRLNSSGAYVWAKAAGGTSNEIGKAITFDNSGNVLITGTFNQTVDFDPGAGTFNLTATGGGFDMFIQKLDAAGNFIWAGAVYGSSDDNPLGICVYPDNKILIGGEYRGTTDFDPGAGTFTLGTGLAAGFILKLDSTGVFNWVKAITTNGNIGIISSITLHSSGTIYTAGYFSDNIVGNGPDFNPGNAVNMVSTTGNNDIFVLKLKPCTAYTLSMNDSICSGQTYTFGAQSLTTAGTYTETFITTTGCDSVVTLNLSVNSLPVVIASSTYSVTCPNQEIMLTGAGAHSYSWTGGVTDSIPFSITVSSSYTVTGTDTMTGCSNTAAVSVTIEDPYGQTLCVVTVDSLTANHNVVVWEKPASLGSIDSFYIYREITTNTYQQIAVVHRDSLSEYHDIAADPNATNYKYKVTTKDTCGNESPMSLYHNSIHLQYFGSGNFQWTAYEIESTGNQVASYNFYRDDNASGNFVLLQVIPGGNTSFSDVNYASFPLARYRVDVNWLNGTICTPTRGAINTSRSNIKSPSSAIGLQAPLNEHAVKIYPQPAAEMLIVETAEPVKQVELTDCLGRVGLTQTELGTKRSVIDVSMLASGMYMLNVTSAGGKYSKKIVIE
jgi:hypothetical protein